MKASKPRLRMFAGPNGSGKSTIKDELSPRWLGVYINPDDMEKAIRQDGYLDLNNFSVNASADKLASFLQNSSLLAKNGLLDDAKQLTLLEGKLNFGSIAVNSYFASVLADYIRHKLLAAQISFTFETVMSSPDKVQFLQKAQQAGFRTYLYYVATEDPDINISRVANRVKLGGHAVPEDKIRERYTRSLALLPQAIAYSNRAYIFDNSGPVEEKVLVAEVTDGLTIEMKTEQMPYWFKIALWDKFDADEGDINVWLM